MRDRRNQSQRNWPSGAGGGEGCDRSQRDLLREGKRFSACDFSASRCERRHGRSGQGHNEVFSRSDGKKCHRSRAADRSANGNAREKGVRFGGISSEATLVHPRSSHNLLQAETTRPDWPKALSNKAFPFSRCAANLVHWHLWNVGFL